ncbi:GGDEF domain-containing protein [Aminipila sp.]|uniref:GGDEF domain-containing protein n=1 Tax=Aminipila sp. TaxID=2060095 RepID=UPI00289C8893|nr:GGDEF domain-containing protein [Aminipila sp.]
MNYIHSFFHRIFLKENTEDFNKKKFMHNNACILALSVYLTIEQLYYGFYMSAFGGLICKIYYGTAFVMVIYAILSGYIQIKKIRRIQWFHKIYEISFGFFGFIVAIARALLVQNNIFALPTIYVAVIYGFAVFFYFSPTISFSIYCLTCASIIILLPVFQPEVIHITYVQDILSNNIIAWIASVITYERYVREYKSQQIISNKNKQLKAKTNRIEKKNKVLQYISNVDDLTNIFNRRKLNEILEIEYDKCKQSTREISLILMDVDLFKSINDTFGHNVGDEVLAQLGAILKNNVSQSDKAGRWGGEEFLIICPETESEDAFMLAEKIRKVIQNYDFKLEYNVTCSFGVATSIETDTITDLMLKADKGLYKAKEGGRNRVEEGK